MFLHFPRFSILLWIALMKLGYYYLFIMVICFSTFEACGFYLYIIFYTQGTRFVRAIHQQICTWIVLREQCAQIYKSLQEESCPRIGGFVSCLRYFSTTCGSLNKFLDNFRESYLEIFVLQESKIEEVLQRVLYAFKRRKNPSMIQHRAQNMIDSISENSIYGRITFGYSLATIQDCGRNKRHLETCSSIE